MRAYFVYVPLFEVMDRRKRSAEGRSQAVRCCPIQKGVLPRFSASERVLYGKRQLIEVICQLRFPTILSISAKEPAEFQEAIRAEFPRYARNLEKLPPKVIGQPGAMKLEEQPTVVNYQFLTAAGDWKVNLTNTFLALATPVYTTWEDFARKLDEVLAQFVAIYHPAYFERIGLRYINGFSRRALGLEGVPFRDLIQPAYLGLMAEDDVQEQSVQRVTQDVEMALAGGCRLKLHCGPGMVKRGNVEDKEVRFILDNDVFMNGKIELKHSAGALNTVHTHADRIFRGAITDQLHDAMEPQPL